MAAPVANQPNLPPNPPGAGGTQIMVPIQTISNTVAAISQDIAKIDSIRKDVSTQYTSALTSVGKLLADTEGFINNVNLTSANMTEAHTKQQTQLLEEKKKLDDANASAQGNMKQLETKLAQMSAKANDTDAQMASLKKEHDALVAQNAQLDAEHKELNAKHQALNQQHQQLDREKKTLDAQVIDLKQQHQQLEQAKAKVETEHQQLNQAKTQLDAEHQKLQQQHGELQTTHQTLQSVRDTLQSDIVLASTSLTALVQKIRDLQESINTLHLTDVKLTKYIDMYAKAPYLIRIRSKFFSDIHNVDPITDSYVTQLSTNVSKTINDMFNAIIPIIQQTKDFRHEDYVSKINTAREVWEKEVNGVTGAYFLCARWLMEQNPSATVGDNVTQKVNAYLEIK